MLDIAVDGGIDDVGGAHDVRANHLERVVLRGRDLLQGRGMDDHVHAVEGAVEPVAVADVADKEAQVAMPLLGEEVAHLKLLQLVAAEDDQLLRPVVAEHDLRELLAEGAGPPGDEHRTRLPVHGASPLA